MLCILSIVINVGSVSVVLLPVLLILQRVFFQKRERAENILTILFGLYIAAVFSVTGLPSINSLTLDPTFQGIPFIDIVNGFSGYMKNTILNIILFLPLGCMAALLWMEFRSLKSSIILGLGLSLFIEIAQIFTYRLTDVDDLITNTLGTVAGYWIAAFFIRKVKFAADLGQERRIREFFVILVLAVAAMFFVRPFIAGHIWMLVW